MFDDLARVGLKPVLAGGAVLIIALVAGWGISADRNLPPVRWMRWWVQGVLQRVLRSPRWSIRAAGIFINNILTTAMLILAGGVSGGAWITVTIVGLAMGVALRILSHASPTPDAVSPSAEAPSAAPGLDRAARWGMAFNMIELPAIALSIGLCMGQLSAPPPDGLPTSLAWSLFLTWVVPALAIAAGGEALWLGRIRPFDLQPPG